MTPSQSFSTPVKIHAGKLKLLDKYEYDRGLERFMDGQELVLTLEEPEIHHSRQQEKFFHGPVLRAFMEHCGYRKEEAKAMLCLRFIPQDIKLMDGSIVRVPGSTAALGKKRYSELIEECIQLAAEEGIYIKDADVWRADRERERWFTVNSRRCINADYPVTFEVVK